MSEPQQGDVVWTGSRPPYPHEMGEPIEEARLTAPEAVVAKTLREHVVGWSPQKGFHCISILCDWYGPDIDHADHVAAEVVKALGLTEERIPLLPRPMRRPARYVTPWVEDGGAK